MPRSGLSWVVILAATSSCLDFDGAFQTCVADGRCGVDGGGATDAGAAKWRQWVDGFAGTTVYDAGCFVQVDPARGNEVVSEAVLPNDPAYFAGGGKLAIASVTAPGFLPSGTQGELHGQVTFSLPDGGGDVQDVFIVRLDNGNGDDVVQVTLHVDGTLTTFSHNGTLADAGVQGPPTNPLAPGVPHVLDLSWSLDQQFLTLTVDNDGMPNTVTFAPDDPTLSTPAAFALGVYRMSADAGTFVEATYDGWEIADDPDAGL